MQSLKTLSELEKIIEVNSAIIKVSASWCGPCRVLSETIKDVISNIDFYSIDIDDCDEDLLDTLNVRSVPVLVFYKNGKECERLLGLKSKSEIENTINKWYKSETES